jgi:hypothetical protein
MSLGPAKYLNEVFVAIGVVGITLVSFEMTG